MMAISARLDQAGAGDEAVEEPLIPGLPDEISEHCLLHLPFPHQSQARSVSSAWNRAISDPSFLLVRKALHLSQPYLFVLAFHRSTFHLQCLSFDPRSHRWHPLPPIPLQDPSSFSPSAFVCSSITSKGELFVLGGMRSDTHAPLSATYSYRATTNSWSVEAPMRTPRSHFAAGCIGGKIFVLGGEFELQPLKVDCYDPAESRWEESKAAVAGRGLAKYDMAVVGCRMYVTEGWTWPFDASPRGGVYDAERDEWGEMRVGMREGWTGSSVVLGERLFVISECGDCKVKVYDEERDAWRCVAGPGVPAEVRKPFAVAGVEGRIYVVAAGMDVAVGKVEERKGEWDVEWEVVEGPKAFKDLSPSDSQVLYA